MRPRNTRPWRTTVCLNRSGAGSRRPQSTTTTWSTPAMCAHLVSFSMSHSRLAVGARAAHPAVVVTCLQTENARILEMAVLGRRRWLIFLLVVALMFTLLASLMSVGLWRKHVVANTDDVWGGEVLVAKKHVRVSVTQHRRIQDLVLMHEQRLRGPREAERSTNGSLTRIEIWGLWCRCAAERPDPALK